VEVEATAAHVRVESDRGPADAPAPTPNLDVVRPASESDFAGTIAPVVAREDTAGPSELGDMIVVSEVAAPVVADGFDDTPDDELYDMARALSAGVAMEVSSSASEVPVAAIDAPATPGQVEVTDSGSFDVEALGLDGDMLDSVEVPGSLVDWPARPTLEPLPLAEERAASAPSVGLDAFPDRAVRTPAPSFAVSAEALVSTSAVLSESENPPEGTGTWTLGEFNLDFGAQPASAVPEPLPPSVRWLDVSSAGSSDTGQRANVLETDFASAGRASRSARKDTLALERFLRQARARRVELTSSSVA
jgi:hypothetical protein